MTTDDGALGRGYRAVRAVRAREDAPWAGTLVRTAAGEACVLVDARTLSERWLGWSAPADGHVLAPADIVRRADGHDAVLPMCAERLEDFVRRRAARLPLSTGEAVTLGVSVLRGCEQIAGLPGTAGEWWLDHTGRPLLATDVSERRALDASASVLDQIQVEPRARYAWQSAVSAVSAERISVHDLDAAEQALFAVAEAEPLSPASLAPRTATELTAPRVDHPPASAPAFQPASRSLWQTLIAGVDDDLADTVSRATTAVWRKLGSRRPAPARGARRAPWLVAAGVAVVVVAAGILWPSPNGPADGDAVPDAVAVSPAATPQATRIAGSQPAPSGTDDPLPAAPEPTDLVAATAALLDDRLACDGDGACLAALSADPGRLPEGAIDLPADERTIALMEDFGDIAVLRVDANDATSSQMVVILRENEKWLLRDVSDVAQQPEMG